MNQPPLGLQALLDRRSLEQQRLTIELRRARLDMGMQKTLAAIHDVAEAAVNDAPHTPSAEQTRLAGPH